MPNYEPLQERAFTYLKKLIASGGLTPGVIYSETRIASEIGISRTPVKDALVRLSQDKYIDIIPSKGFRLHSMTPEDIWATYQARTAVEGFCALTLAQERNTARGKAALRRMKQSMEAMEEVGSCCAGCSEFLACDMEFHRVLAEFPRNEELSSLFESLHHRVSLIAQGSLSQPGRLQEALREHWDIYNAIVDSGEGPQIQPYMAVLRHMEASRDIVLAHQGG